MKASAVCASLLLSRAIAEAAWGSGDAHVQSTAMRLPSPQANGARGAPHLPLRFSAKPSPSAPWARGLLSAFWERGSPDLPACGLRHGSSGGPARPVFISTRLKTLARGQASRGGRCKASSRMASPGRLARRWRDQGRVPREVLVTQAMMIKTRRAPGRRRPAQCPCFLFGAKGASTDAEYRGIKQRLPFQCNKTKTSGVAGWRSPWSPRRRHRQCLWQTKTNFSQDNLY